MIGRKSNLTTERNALHSGASLMNFACSSLHPADPVMMCMGALALSYGFS